MIQHILPRHYHNEYCPVGPTDRAFVLSVREQRVLCRFTDTDAIELPSLAEARSLWEFPEEALQFLYRVDETAYYYLDLDLPEKGGFRRCPALSLLNCKPADTVFCAAVGAHLAFWYDTSRFCGRCGRPMSHRSDQRALLCSSCGLTVWPRINPIVITAVVDGDYILVAKYNRKHFKTEDTRYVLLAGYVEIGESLEDAVLREVREETGLQVSRLHYAASQPWPYSQSVVAGFYAEADRSRPLKMQQDELSELVWISREELPPRNTLISVTDNLFEWFRAGHYRRFYSDVSLADPACRPRGKSFL